MRHRGAQDIALLAAAGMVLLASVLAHIPLGPAVALAASAVALGGVDVRRARARRPS